MYQHADNEAIARRAYTYFMARGYTHGYDLEDWVRAETELQNEMKSSEPSNVASAKAMGTDTGVTPAKSTRKKTKNSLS